MSEFSNKASLTLAFSTLLQNCNLKAKPSNPSGRLLGWGQCYHLASKHTYHPCCMIHIKREQANGVRKINKQEYGLLYKNIFILGNFMIQEFFFLFISEHQLLVIIQIVVRVFVSGSLPQVCKLFVKVDIIISQKQERNVG